jgi:hypothetical protein
MEQKWNSVYSIKLCNTYSNMHCLDLKIRCKQWKTTWNKMDSIVILDLKCIVFITFLTKLKGYMWGEKQEEIKPWMSILIEKQNFNNN